MEEENINQQPAVNMAKVDLLAALGQVFETISPSIHAVSNAKESLKSTLSADLVLKERSFEVLTQIKDKFME